MIKIVEITDPYGFIYITTNMVNGRKYMGQKIFDNRWKNYLGSGVALKQAVMLYGKTNFAREIIAIAFSKKELDLLEIAVIKSQDATEDRNYYNISHGGDGNHGLLCTEQTRLKISMAGLGRIVSKETREMIRESNTGKHVVSVEARKRLSDRAIARDPLGRKHASVICMDLSGNYVMEYFSVSGASRITNVKRTNIGQCLSGRTKTAGGFKWKYAS